MVCVYCRADTRVVNSRQQIKNNNIWRRRKCTECAAVFTSTEMVDLAAALRVSYLGQLQPFNRDLLFLSLYESCKHRQVAARDAANLTRQVISRLLAIQTPAGLITREQIIHVCEAVLHPFDSAAAVVYSGLHSPLRERK